MLSALLLNWIDVLLSWLLTSSLDPERSSVLGCPLSTFKSFEAHDKQACPRLVHAETHTSVVRFFVEIFVTRVSLLLLSSIFNNCFFDCSFKLIEWVLSLESLGKRVMQELDIFGYVMEISFFFSDRLWNWLLWLFGNGLFFAANWLV